MRGFIIVSALIMLLTPFFLSCTNIIVEDTPSLKAFTSPIPHSTLTVVPTADTWAETTSNPYNGVNYTYVVNCEAYLNLREAPDPSSKMIGKVYAGERVRIMGYYERYAHIEISSSGLTGYILSGYLEPEDGDRILMSIGVSVNVGDYSYETMMLELNRLSDLYPNSLRISSIGSSEAGADIPVAIVGDETAKHHVLIQAAIHAREHMTTQLVMAQIAYCLKYADTPNMSTALDEVCFHIIPMVNPDGVRISQSGGGNAEQLLIYERELSAGRKFKSRFEYFTQWKANGRGVDLNRNFDAGWVDVKDSYFHASNGFKGDAPESEKETQALVNYTGSMKFDATISYHSTGSVVYWEYSGASAAVNSASKSLAQRVFEATGYPLEPSGTSAAGYKDWAALVCGIPSITIETGSLPCPLDKTEFATIWDRNKDLFFTIAMWIKERD